MGTNSINIGWNKYEVALLIDSYNYCVKGKSTRKDAIARLSKRLRRQMAKLGMSISETFRNENGITLQMSAMEYILTEGERGIPNHSRLFEEIAFIYKRDHVAFEKLVAIANIMYPYQIVEKVDIPPTPQAKHHGLLFEPPTKYINKKIKLLLEKYFPQGYRLESIIENKRFVKYYFRDYGISLTKDIEDINADIKACGIVHEKRVYLPDLMLSETKKKKLVDYICKTFDEGRHYIFYAVLFEIFHDDFLESNIYDEQMLEKYLDYINDGQWFFRKSFFTNIATEKPNILSEVIDYVKQQGKIVSEEEVISGLPFLPEQEVRSAFCEKGVGLIICGRKQRCHIDNFLISDDELKEIENVIKKAIEQYQYISLGELINDLKKLVPSFIENNEHFGDIALRNLLSTKLSDIFTFKGNVISDKCNPIKTEDAFKALAKREHFVLEDINSLADECGTQPNVYISSLLKYSVRINDNEFVSQNYIHFNIEKTDEVLGKIITKDFIPLQEFIFFTLLPDCGYTWNSFLIESYVYNHSKLFCLMHASMFNTTMALGSIVKKSAHIPDFESMVALSVIENNIRLNQDDIINHMCEKKYINRHRYKDTQKIIKKAMQLKSKQ